MKLFDKVSVFKILNYFGYALVGEENGVFQLCKNKHNVYVYFNSDIGGFQWVDSFLKRGGSNELGVVVCDGFGFDGVVLNNLHHFKCFEPVIPTTHYTEREIVIKVLGCFKIEDNLPILSDPLFAGRFFSDGKKGFRVLLFEDNKVVNAVTSEKKGAYCLNSNWGINEFNIATLVLEKNELILSWCPEALVEYHETFNDGGGLFGKRVCCIPTPGVFGFVREFDKIIKGREDVELVVLNREVSLSNSLQFICLYLNNKQNNIQFSYLQYAGNTEVEFQFMEELKPHELQNKINEFYQGFKQSLEDNGKVSLAVLNDSEFGKMFGFKCVLNMGGAFPSATISFNSTTEATGFLVQRLIESYADHMKAFSFVFM
jgi:hypothetical protein